MPAWYIHLLSLCCYVLVNCTELVYRILLSTILQLITGWEVYVFKSDQSGSHSPLRYVYNPA